MMYQVKKRAGHFELWAFENKTWFFVARRGTINEIKHLILGAK